MKIASYLVIIFFAPAILLLNFHLLVFNKNFYKSEFTKLNVYREFSSQEEVDDQTSKLIQYLCCNGTLDDSFFDERERLHLFDVKNLIKIVNVQFFLFSTLILICFGLNLREKKFTTLFSSLKWGSALAILAILLLWVSTTVNFEKVFVNFHFVVFQNDYWQLPPESNLLKLFPQQFFVDFANRIAIQTILMAAVTFIASFFFGAKFDTKKR